MSEEYSIEINEPPTPGMTPRDYFAALAMRIRFEKLAHYANAEQRLGVAQDAYKMADAMLEARNLRSEPRPAKACITLPGTNITVAPDDGPGLYTNLDSTTSAQKPDGTNPTQAEIDAPTNSIGYVKSANASALCGFTDWRLPTKKELKLMLQQRQVLGMVGEWYWSSSPYVDYSDFAWFVVFGDGHVNYGNRYSYFRVRLVRDTKGVAMNETKSPKRKRSLEDVRCECCGYMTHQREHMGCIRSAKNRATVDRALQTLETKSKEANKVETPTLILGTKFMAAPDDGFGRYTNLDSTTSAQKPDGTNPTQAEIDAPTNSIGYVKSANASALCGFTDWRLPTMEELKLLYPHRKMLGMVRRWYWSSSPYVGVSSYAWVVTFSNGGVYRDYRSSFNRVRLVRDVADTDSYLKEKAREQAEAVDRAFARARAREELEQRERSKKLIEKIHGAAPAPAPAPTWRAA